ncbi:hypothetical protein C8J57DRAFT_1478697 [Mycena rebaudengoi]|nr:hypothetical protein C8J57DRAFT_1478697 [Mycena rebaudengoi]
MKADVDNVYGMLLTAGFVSTCLYGVGILQFWMYIRKYYRKDSMIVKSLVITVLVCDTVQQTLMCHGIYTFLVSSIADPVILTILVKTMMVEVFFSGAIATLVQQSENPFRFYCWRIYKLSSSILLAGAVVRIFLFSCFGVLVERENPLVVSVWATKALKLKLLAEMITLKSGLTGLQTFSMAANSLSAATDVMISVVLVLLLQYSKTGFRRSTDLINRLVYQLVFALWPPLFTSRLSRTLFSKSFRMFSNILEVLLNYPGLLGGRDTSKCASASQSPRVFYPGRTTL